MKLPLDPINALRALAVVCIVAIHVTSGQAESQMAVYLWNQAGRFASPLFIFLSGFLLYLIEARRPSADYKSFLGRRLNRVAVPYVLWTAFYTVYQVFSDSLEVPSEDPLSFLIQKTVLHTLNGQGFSHLYFVLIMVQLYALFPLLYRWVQHAPRLLLAGSFALTLATLTAIYAHQNGQIILPSLPVAWTALFPGWLFYFVLGMVASGRIEEWQSFLRPHALKLGAGWLLALAVLLWDGKITGTYAISVKPTTMLYFFMSLLLLVHLLSRLTVAHAWLVRAVDWTAKQGFAIYLVHPFILSILVKSGQKFGFASIWYGFDGALLLFATTCILTCSTVSIINLMPFSAYLGGRRNDRRRVRHVA